MDLRKLPSAAISAIGQGATRLGTRASHDRARVEARIAAMRHGIVRGLSYIDTAPLYGAGFSEEVVGEALVGLRKRCFLATKIGLDDDSSHAGIRQSIRDSMARLGTDYLDLVQVHWPNPFVHQEEIFGALEAAVVAGEVRFVGVSNHCAGEIREAQRCLTTAHIASNQYEFNLLNRGILGDLKTLDRAVLLIAYSPLNQGRLTASRAQSRIVEAIAADRGATPAQVVLAALLADGDCVAVVRASSIAHVDEAAGALELALTAGERERIWGASPAGPELVAAEDVELTGTAMLAPYRSAEEAWENRHSLLPSPAALAERFRRGALPMPLRLKRQSNGRYLGDDYDPMDQVKKYWAWVLARPGAPVPAYIMEG